MKDLLIASIIHQLVKDPGAHEICHLLAIQATRYYERELEDGEEVLGEDFKRGCMKLWEASGCFGLEDRIQESNRNAKERKQNGRIS